MPAAPSLYRGNDAMEFAADFWHRLSKIEEAYAKSLNDLCASRTAKLTRMFVRNFRPDFQSMLVSDIRVSRRRAFASSCTLKSLSGGLGASLC